MAEFWNLTGVLPCSGSTLLPLAGPGLGFTPSCRARTATLDAELVGSIYSHGAPRT